MGDKTAQPWHTETLFGPYRFFNVGGGNEEQAQGGHSFINREEVNVALAIYDRIRTQFNSVNFDYRIGIVTMYRGQMLKLKNEFKVRHGHDILSKIDFNTVDGFQGQEKDIIILSCVRAGPNVQAIGFLADMRRMNVALTRSRSSLFVLGNAPTLERGNLVWKQIIQDARERNCLQDVSHAIPI